MQDTCTSSVELALNLFQKAVECWESARHGVVLAVDEGLRLIRLGMEYAEEDEVIAGYHVYAEMRHLEEDLQWLKDHGND